jgi:uridylate kinase
MKPKYGRILLKLSGEALLGEQKFGIDYKIMHQICEDIAQVHKMGVQVAVVIGAGNIWRGAQNSDSGITRVPSDYIGMMGTIMNSVALQANLEKIGITTRICSALDIPSVAEPYIKRRAVRHLEKDRVVICAAGTGNPYFTTDSAAGLRSLELECDILLKGTNVDGVYDRDPQKDPTAKRFDRVTFEEVLEKKLRVMDATAIAQCRDHRMPIIVFKLLEKGNIARVVCGEKCGTHITFSY